MQTMYRKNNKVRVTLKVLICDEVKHVFRQEIKNLQTKIQSLRVNYCF